jgi:amino acid adenylation domain-containing protein
MPSQPALEFRGTVQTRSEVADRSDRLAAFLIAHGAGCGALVGIYMERSIEMVIGVLGVLKAGAAYVPLDPMFPRMRIEQILGETKVPVLLTLTRHLKDLHGLAPRLLSLDGDPPELPAEPLEAAPKIDAGMRAYVIFTSGSTGVPKGVEVSHGSVVNLLLSAQEMLEMGPQDRLFAITTLAFDISVLELLLPLVSGGTVILAEQDAASNAARLMEQLRSTGATALQATPVTFRALLDAGFTPPPGFKILCGGEAWTMATAERLLASGSRVWNMYGPTETTVWSSIAEVKPDEPRLAIGPPIANTRFYVVDENLNPVPPGGRGELLIAGAGVALGYFQRELLTAEKFLPDPKVPGERMFRSGDEVKQLADGRLEFIGRLDRQIKLRGFRIELGEIEAAMAACAGVRDAVATLRKDEAGEEFLVGFYTAEDAVTALQLRESSLRRIPAYMVPRFFQRLEAFPLTPNGKTDRLALLGYPLSAYAASSVVEGKTESSTEHEMAEMWRKVFPGAAIDGDSDFFELGGDSLLLVLLQSMIDRRFGLRLNAIDITNHFTVRKLANWVDDSRVDGGEPKKAPAEDPRLLPLQRSGAGHPIFIFPQLMVFRTLAEELGGDQPVYGVQIMDEDVPQEMETASMESLARYYVGLIRKAQPRGPYRLAGWCLWGWMAYEIARQLEEQGEEIELLVIIDALAPGFWDSYSRSSQMMMGGISLMYRLGWFARRLWSTSLAKRDREGLRRMRTLAFSIASALPRSLRPAGYHIETTRLDRIVTSASALYRPPPIQGKVLVFKSEVRPTFKLMGRDMGWSKVLGRAVRVNSLPGNHREIFHPVAARMMAKQIHEALRSKAESAAFQGMPWKSPLPEGARSH